MAKNIAPFYVSKCLLEKHMQVLCGCYESSRPLHDNIWINEGKYYYYYYYYVTKSSFNLENIRYEV